jgi:membrane protease YdiL (CAAX protease family)
MCALALGGLTIPFLMRLWPAPLFIALVVTAFAARVMGNADAFRWLTRGSISWRVVAAMVLTIVVSIAALLLWVAVLRPPLVDNVRLPPAPLWLIAAGAVGWSMLNAVGEECVFRGMLLDALRTSMSSTTAVVVQAMAFGLIHFRGFPSGWVGVALAAVYGLMLGALRLRAGGMLAPVLTHVFADLTIMGIIFLPVLRPP